MLCVRVRVDVDVDVEEVRSSQQFSVQEADLNLYCVLVPSCTEIVEWVGLQGKNTTIKYVSARASEGVNFLNRTFILIVSVCIQPLHQCHPLIRHCHSVFGAKDRRRGSTIMNASSGVCR
jgi:hypothetical protein